MSDEGSSFGDNNLLFDDIIGLINNRQCARLKSAFESKSFQDINLKNDDSLLMRACKNGDEESVKILLAYGADVSFESHHSRHTALSLACFHGYESIVKILVDLKADPNLPGLELPLVQACKGGYLKIVELLLHNGAKVDQLPYFVEPAANESYYYDSSDDGSGPGYYYGPNALMVACSTANIDIVQVLLSAGAKLDICLEDIMDDTKGFTALTFACRGYHWDLVKLLIGLGADVNDKYCIEGPTPLMYACIEGNLRAVEMLLDLGADINQVEHRNADPLAPTPLSVACLHGHIAVAKFILERKDFTVAPGVIQRAFIDTCEHGNAEIIALLRPRLGDLNDLIKCQARASIPQEFTLLSEACRLGRIKAAQKLLELGATVSVKGDQGHRALTAIGDSDPSAEALVTLLVEHGANVNSIDSEGNTPLMKLAELQHTQASTAFKTLLNYGADVSVKNKKGQTVLDIIKSYRSSQWRRRDELEDLCKQYEECNRRDRVSDAVLLK